MTDSSELLRAKAAVLEYLRPLLTDEQLREASSRIARFAAEAVRRERRVIISAHKASQTADPYEAMVNDIFGRMGGKKR